MATIYLRSTDGNDSDDGSTWALAKATLAAALTAAGAGGTVYVSQSHAETQASAMTLASPGTAGSVTRVLCGNDSAEPPTSLATTATVTTSGTSSISFAGFCYCYGITFNCGTSSTSSSALINFTSASPWWWKLESCSLTLSTTGSGARIRIGVASTSTDDNLLEMVSTNAQFGAKGQGFSAVSGKWIWDRGSISGSTYPTSLIYTSSNMGIQAVLHGLDLSVLGSGNSLVTSGSGTHTIKILSCKLGSSVSVLAATAIQGQGATQVLLDNCDSSDTNYRMEHYKYQGSIKTETSKIRSGGASDGTTPISWNMTSLAGATFVSPLESPPISIWNETTGSSKTVTVEIAQDSAATALNDDEIWLEVEYLGTSGYPISSIASDRKANILSSAAAQTTSSVTWNNMTNPTKQKLEVSFTPQEKGLFTARVMLAKASTTVYVDPLITVS